MTALRHVAALSLVVLSFLSSSAHAQDARKQFGRWAAACSGDAWCTISTKLPGGNAPSYAYQLRVSRFQSGTQEIAFLPAAATPAPDAPIEVAVDGKPRFTLDAGSGYRRVGGSNTFVVDQGRSDDLLRALREGRRVSLRYATAAGNPAQADFSLQGYVQAAEYARIAAPAAAVESTPAATATVEAAPAAAPTVQAPPAAKPAGTRKSRKKALPATAAEESPAPANAPEPAAVVSESGSSPSIPAATLPAPPETPVAPAQAPAAAATAASPPPRPAATSAPSLPAPSLGEVQPAAPPPSSPPPAGRKRAKAVLQFACRGNEPAWSLAIDHDTARYLTLQGSEPQAVPLQGKLRVTGEGRTPDVDWRGKAADGSAYKVLIQEQACRDSMADAASGALPYRARLTLPGGKIVQGCCSAGLETARRESAPSEDLEAAPVANLATRSADDWSRFLFELLPAVRACIEKTPGQAAYVTKAWPMSRGMVGVRTRNAAAGWFDCTAQYDGSGIERFEAVTSDAEPVVGEGRVLFTPLPDTPLSGRCWQQEKVVDSAGRQIGWLSTNGC